jgi:hypothetical protein
MRWLLGGVRKAGVEPEAGGLLEFARAHAARERNAAGRGVYSMNDMLATPEHSGIDACQTGRRLPRDTEAFMERVKGIEPSS